MVSQLQNDHLAPDFTTNGLETRKTLGNKAESW
jgi:hypothetical protein